CVQPTNVLSHLGGRVPPRRDPWTYRAPSVVPPRCDGCPWCTGKAPPPVREDRDGQAHPVAAFRPPTFQAGEEPPRIASTGAPAPYAHRTFHRAGRSYPRSRGGGEDQDLIQSHAFAYYRPRAARRPPQATYPVLSRAIQAR